MAEQLSVEALAMLFGRYGNVRPSATFPGAFVIAHSTGRCYWLRLCASEKFRGRRYPTKGNFGKLMTLEQTKAEIRAWLF